MTLLAALATGLALALATATATGHSPRLRRTRPRTQAGARQLWLVQAGVALTPRQFWLGSALAGAAAFAVVVLVTGTVAVAVIPAVAVATLPRAYLAHRRAARMREIQEAWPDGIRDLVAGISSGMSLNQAIIALANGGPMPLRRAFARYPVLTRVVGVVPALEVVAEELADPTSDRVIEVLILAHERGGHILSDILRDLATATTADVRALEEIETEGLEQRINAGAVFVLPWLVLLALTLQPGHFRDFYRSAAGVAVVLVGGLLSALGIWLVGHLGREPEEQRVFGSSAPARGEPR